MSHLRKTLFHLCKTGLSSSKRGLFVHKYNKKSDRRPEGRGHSFSVENSF